MHCKATTVLATVLGLSLLGASQVISTANLQNWEGPQNDPTANNRAVNWWYVQIVGQTPADNGIPASIGINFKHGNIYQFGPDNTPVYSIEIYGFDTNGMPFGNVLSFNASVVSPTSWGVTRGVWGDNEVTFSVSEDLKTFDMNFDTDWVKGAITLDSKSPSITGCGGTQIVDSPFFDGLAKDRNLTDAEDLLFNQNGWRMTMFAAEANVDVTIGGKTVAFFGNGYKDVHWAPNAMNDFISTWYVMIATVGPYSFVTFTVQPTSGTNLINTANLLENGRLISSQCNVVGERDTDISIIQPSGEVLDSGVIAPTTFNLTFVLPDRRTVAFQATTVAENPSFSIYHRWVAKYEGGVVGGPSYTGHGLVEWINAANLSHWISI